MKITKLELKDYERFAVKGISYFTYTPETTIQIILGANGSGKSSLLKELSPLPAHHTEFKKGGYKKITIEHNGSIYELLSDITLKGNRYSFLKDSIELNPGYTISVYRDLVRTEFGITQEIHELMIGQSRFSNMDISTRRNWFTKLPSTDYSYAIRYFKKLSEQLRDSTGAIKHVTNKLLQEKDRQVSQDELNSLRDELKNLKEYQAYLLENKSKAKYSVQETESSLVSINNHIVDIYKDMASKIVSFDNPDNALSIQDLGKQIREHNNELISISTLIEATFKEASDIQISIEELERNKADSVEHLEKRMSDRKKYISSIYKNLKLNLEFSNPLEALNALNISAPYLVDIFNQLEADPDKAYSKAFYDSNLDRIANSTKMLNKEKENINQITLEIKKQEHLKEHDAATCPKCNHTFNRSFNESYYQSLIDVKEEAIKKASSISESIEELTKLKEDLYKRFELLRDFSQLSRSHGSLSSFWDYVRREYLFKDPKSINTAINTARIDLEILSEAHKLLANEEDEAKSLKIMLSFRDSSLQDLKDKYNSLSDKLHTLQESQRYLKRRIQSKNKAYSIAESLISLQTKLNLSIEERDIKLQSLKDTIRNELQGKLIQQVMLEITIRENTINSISNQNSVVSELEKQLESLNRRRDVLKAAVSILSPSEGLIAKGITGFINHFVKQMNSFIKNIWSYPFEILPIEINESLDLDYRFALKIGDSGYSPDISKISRGQQEIIDLAFRIVAAQYLGLSQAPLYLDEFGSSFDKDHRQTVSEMMHTLTSTSSFSQIYIISHYEEMYGSFRNTDITSFYDPKFETVDDTAFNKVATFN